MTQIIWNVEFIHSQNVIHRDIKPENILINENFDIRIIDFGLSIIFDVANYDVSFTTQCGTLIYMAPEVFSVKNYSKPVDIWSTAIILYQLFNKNKHPLFKDRLPKGEYIKILINTTTFNPIQEGFDKFSFDLFTKMTQIDPSLRYSAYDCLQHPFITRDFNKQAPRTLNELVEIMNFKKILQGKFKQMLFIQYLVSKKNQRDIKVEKIENKIDQTKNTGQNMQKIVRNLKSRKETIKLKPRSDIMSNPLLQLTIEQNNMKNGIKTKQEPSLQLENMPKIVQNSTIIDDGEEFERKLYQINKILDKKKQIEQKKLDEKEVRYKQFLLSQKKVVKKKLMKERRLKDEIQGQLTEKVRQITPEKLIQGVKNSSIYNMTNVKELLPPIIDSQMKSKSHSNHSPIKGVKNNIKYRRKRQVYTSNAKQIKEICKIKSKKNLK